MAISYIFSVYKGYNHNNHELVAIKVVRKTML